MDPSTPSSPYRRLRHWLLPSNNGNILLVLTQRESPDKLNRTVPLHARLERGYHNVAKITAAMDGKICLVTGATSGIGLVTAHALAQQGATLIVVGRNPARSKATVDQIIQASGNLRVEMYLADLSSQAQIKQLADSVTSRFGHLDVLVNNAGALFTKRSLSPDGIEMTFALNHLGYFLLTHLLRDALEASPAARIVNVASGAHRAGNLHFDDIQGQRNYGGWQAYCQSKLANIMFTYELATRLKDTHITANVMHPGFVSTRFGHNNAGVLAWVLHCLQLAALSPEKGSKTIIYLATSPEVAEISGHYFIKQRAVKSSSASYDKDAAQRLWLLSEHILNL